jgi:hypothetical protein
LSDFTILLHLKRSRVWSHDSVPRVRHRRAAGTRRWRGVFLHIHVLPRCHAHARHFLCIHDALWSFQHPKIVIVIRTEVVKKGKKKADKQKNVEKEKDAEF